MNTNIDNIKALQFEYEIDKLWWNDNTKPMNQLLEMVDIPYDRTDLMDFGYLLSEDCIDTFGLTKTIQMMASFIPFNCQNVHTDESEGQTCLNQKCSSYNNGKPNCYTIFSDFWADIHLYIYLAMAIGGESALKELKKEWSDIDSEIFYLYFHDNKGDIRKGIYEKELYEDNLSIEDVVKIHLAKIKGDDKMSKPFWDALSDLKGELSVFWTYGTMYINGEDDTQASTSGVTLFQAYRFASIIQTNNFDYDASDEAIKEFQKELLKFYQEVFSEDEQKKYIIDVWEYLDDIADDYKKLTGININDIDYKRTIVSYMSETDWENNCAMGFGSGTYIARLISDHIVGDERNNVARCNNPLAIELAEKYLQTDDYDIIKFAEELHKRIEELHMNTYNKPTTLDAFIKSAYHLTERCYFIGTSLLSEQKEFDLKFMVGVINWQGDWEKPIYCCMNSKTKDIWFEANGTKSAFIYDMALPHLMCGCDFNEIQIKLTHDNVNKIMKEYNLEQKGIIDAYIHCNMYGTQAKLQDYV